MSSCPHAISSTWRMNLQTKI